MAVYEQEDPRVESPRSVEASEPEVVVVAIVRDEEAVHPAQDVRKGSCAEAFEFVGRDQGDRRGRFGHLLVVSGGSEHEGDLPKQDGLFAL
jgi:hypothetical protein